MAQISRTPQTLPASTIVPAWPDGPGFKITGIPESETFVILGAGGEIRITAGSNGLPSQSTYIATGTVEGYIETDSLDVSNVNYLGSAGALTVNGTSAGTAPTVTNATSSVTAFAVNPTNNATYQLTSETQTCYLLPIPIGEAPAPSGPPPCGDDCDPDDPDPGPEAVSNQITLTQIAPFAEGSGFPASYACVAYESSPISVTFTGVPHIASISQQYAYANNSGTFTVTGTNLEDSDGVSVPNFSTTITSSLSGSAGQSSENVSFSVPSTQTPGNYQFTISNMWGTSNGVSFGVPYPPVTVTGISPATWIAGQSYQAVQITGTNFGTTPAVKLSDPTITVSAPYNTSTASGISTTSINLSVPATTPSEPVVVTVTPGSGGSSFSQVPGGPSLPGSNTAAVVGLQQSACPEGLDSNGNSGFSSIVSTGNAAGSGSMTISFSAGAFNGLAVTAPYGPYSTPESVASHLAALITKQYAGSGLTAQADGANILYKSSATLGTVSFVATGASFMANAAPMSCPSINLKYVLAVENDTVQWQQTNNQRGREVTYQLMLWPIVNKTKPLALIRFSDLTPASPAIIKEHLGNTNVASWNGYTSDNTFNPVAVTAGQFEDILGTGTWPNAVTGTALTDRWFSVTLNGAPLPGSIQTLDRAGGNAPANALHQKDHIVINLPTVGAPLLSGTSILNGASWDVSLQ